MVMKMTEPWTRWVPVVERLLWQCYYRILSFVSFPAPVDEVFLAAEFLSTRDLFPLGGSVKWVVPDRIFVWDEVEFSPGLMMDVWFMGSALRRKNTAMARGQWWKLYLYVAALPGEELLT
jgi:hypothetical protein